MDRLKWSYVSHIYEYCDFYNAKQKVILMIIRKMTKFLQGTFFARISRTASSATRMFLPTTATSVEKSSASIQRSKQDKTELSLQQTNGNIIEKQYHLQKPFPVNK